MRKSNYNILSQKSNLLFNTLTRAMAVLTDEDYHLFLSSTPDFTKLDADTLNEFIESGFIISDDRDELSEIKHSYWQAKFDMTTLHITIMTTLDCNFRCVYCFEKHKKISMDESTIESVKGMISQKLKQGYSVLSVDWYGGEPLLNMNCIRLLSSYFIQLCRDNGIEYVASITTNGYNFTPDIQHELFELGVRHAQITLDGSKNIHDNRRILLTGDSSFEVIKHNIINAHDGMTISLRINVDNDNQDDLINLIDSFEGHRSDMLGIYACIVTPALDSDYIVENRDSLMRSIIDMYAYSLKKGFQINNVNSLLTSTYRACIVDSNSHFIISPLGELYKCGESYEDGDPGLIGYITQTGEMAINIEKLSRWTKDPFAYPECLECVHLPTCMGGCIMKRITRSDNFCSWEYKDCFTDILELLYEAICSYSEGSVYEKIAL